MSENTASKSVEELEAEIAAARTRLAGTVDELHTRTAPQEIARRQVESAKAKFTEATRTERRGPRRMTTAPVDGSASTAPAETAAAPGRPGWGRAAGRPGWPGSARPSSP